MKILIIPSSPTFEHGARGYLFATHLVELGNEVHFLFWDPYPRDIKSFVKNLFTSLRYKTYIKDGIMVHKIRRLPIFFPPVNSYMFKRFIYQLFKQNKLDAIISQSFFNEIEPPLDLPLIYDIMDHHEAYMHIYAGKIEKLALKYILNLRKSVHAQIRHSAAVTAVSNILVDYAKNIAPATKVFKIPNGVDAIFLEQSHENKENNYGKHSMVYVSHFGEWANLPKLIEATANLRKAYPDIRLILVGDGTALPSAKKFANKLGLADCIYFMGQVSRERVANIVNACELALCPCKKDLYRDSSFPIKIMEYTAVGKKVVSSNLEEIKLLSFPNITFYDDCMGAKELAEAISKAFDTDIDVEATRKSVYKYTWRAIAKQFQDIIQEFIIQKNG